MKTTTYLIPKIGDGTYDDPYMPDITLDVDEKFEVVGETGSYLVCKVWSNREFPFQKVY